MISLNSLHTNGFYTGQLSDVDPSFVISQDIIREIRSVDTTNNDFYSNVLDVETELNWPFHMSSRDFLEKVEIAEKNDFRIKQRWKEMNFAPRFDQLKHYFRTLVVGFIRQAYPEIKEDFSNLGFTDRFSLFEKDDFIFPHNDGHNQGRFCVVLMHLNTLEESRNNGGQLLVYFGDNKISIDPIIGGFTILDFNNHNLIHEVTKVLNDFKRYTYIAFLYNTDKVGDNWIPYESQKYKY